MHSTLGKRKERDGGEAVAHGSTLFVSNLPYTATSTDLQTLFSDIAPVRTAFVVLEHGTSVSKGVGYVSFAIREDAVVAFESITKKRLVLQGRKLRVQWANSKVPKPRHGRAPHASGEEKAEGTSRGADNESDGGKDSGEESDEDRVGIGAHKGSDEEISESTVDVEGSDDDDEAVDDETDDDNDQADDDDDQADDDDESEDDQQPVKPQLPPPESGTTLFVRNVPFEATEDELRIMFRAFGPLRYARITIDFETGRSRGTGFVCFWNKADADKVVEQSEILRTETTGPRSHMAKKNPFTLPSILTPDPSSVTARSLVLQGRTLDVVRAVTRDEAGKLKEEGEKQREKADKRNMYLLREGVITPNSPAAKALTPVELEQRTSSFNARKSLLKSNPSLYVSKTRLSVRQIPTFVSERVLKRLAIHATRAFQTEVKKGSREALTSDELSKDVVEDNSEEKGDPPRYECASKGKGKKQKYGKAGRQTSVKQAKIVRQQDRVDPITGKGRSRGYGFVEMHKHSDALRVLRWANNNPDIMPLLDEWRKAELEDVIKLEKGKADKDDARIKRMKDELENHGSTTRKIKSSTLIVEFSIENVQVVQRRAALQKDKSRQPTEKKPRRETESKRLQEPPSKKRRTDDDNNHEASTKRPGQNIGSIIGRKRKERKSGK